MVRLISQCAVRWAVLKDEWCVKADSNICSRGRWCHAELPGIDGDVADVRVKNDSRPEFSGPQESAWFLVYAFMTF